MSAKPEIFTLLTCDEDEEDNETFQRQVLFVPPIEPGEDLSSPPMDGFQFLKRVVEETKRCDAVVKKPVEMKLQKNVAKQVLDFPEERCRPEFYLDKDVQLHTVAEFSKLRTRYEARRSKIPENEFLKLSAFVRKKRKSNEWLDIFSNTPTNVAENLGLPNSSIELCIVFSKMRICSIMARMEDYLTERELSVPLVCQWIYTLLACVDLPLDPDLFATLRGITRTLISHRAQLESLDSEELPHINVIICIIGRYFNQLDLADPMD